MDFNLIQASKHFKIPTCTRQHHSKELRFVCSDQDCPKYLSVCCEVCLEEHQHKGVTIKETGFILEQIALQMGILHQDIQEEESKQGSLTNEFNNLQQDFVMLVNKLNQIGNQIRIIKENIQFKKQKEYIASLDIIMEEILHQESEDMLKLSMKKMKNFICFDHKDQVNPIKIKDSDIKQKFDINISSDQYFTKMRHFYKELNENLEKIVQKSGQFDKFNISWKLVKGKINQSEEIQEIEPGTFYMGSNNGAQIVLSDQMFNSGVHEMSIKIEKLYPGEHRLLSLGIIQEDVCMKAFPTGEYGCNKCIFRKNSQDQMIQIGEGQFETNSFEDLITEGSTVRCVLDFENDSFCIYPPNTQRKFVSKFANMRLQNKKWRFCIMWNGSQYAVRLVSSV